MLQAHARTHSLTHTSITIQYYKSPLHISNKILSFCLLLVLPYHNPFYIQIKRYVETNPNFTELSMIQTFWKLVKTIPNCHLCDSCLYIFIELEFWPRQLMLETENLLHQFGTSCAYQLKMVIRLFLWT